MNSGDFLVWIQLHEPACHVEKHKKLWKKLYSYIFLHFCRTSTKTRTSTSAGTSEPRYLCCWLRDIATTINICGF